MRRAATQPDDAAVQRVLVISLPATSWADIEAADAPHLRQLLADSAVADMVTRAAGRKSSIAGGYTTLGAGGRASAVTPLAGQAFETTRALRRDAPPGDVYRQRTGLTVTGGIVHLGIDALDPRRTPRASTTRRSARSVTRSPGTTCRAR